MELLVNNTIFIVAYSDGEHEFLDLNEKLSKLAKFAPHLWKDDVSDSTNIYFYLLFSLIKTKDRNQKQTNQQENKLQP